MARRCLCVLLVIGVLLSMPLPVQAVVIDSDAPKPADQTLAESLHDLQISRMQSSASVTARAAIDCLLYHCVTQQPLTETSEMGDVEPMAVSADTPFTLTLDSLPAGQEEACWFNYYLSADGKLSKVYTACIPACQYRPSWTVGAHGSLRVTDAAGTAYASGEAVVAGTELTVQAIPDEGYLLRSLLLDGEPFADGGSFAVRSNSRLEASFVQEDPEAASGFAAGSGTEQDPYVIETAAELKYFVARVNGGDTMAGCFVLLGADISLDGITLTPIGTQQSPFAGSLDGGGHMLRDLTISVTEAAAAGFFAYLSGNVSHLTLENAAVTLTTGTANQIGALGALTGVQSGGSVISDVLVSGTVGMQGFSDSSCGGIAGSAKGTIQDSYSTADVGIPSGSGSAYAGGVAGRNSGLIERCYASGCVSVGPLARRVAGGIAGMAAGTLRDCASRGDRKTIFSSGSTGYCGGIAGYLSGTAERCVYLGGTLGDGYCGGITGYLKEGGTAQSCITAGKISFSTNLTDYAPVSYEVLGTVSNCYYSSAGGSYGSLQAQMAAEKQLCSEEWLKEHVGLDTDTVWECGQMPDAASATLQNYRLRIGVPITVLPSEGGTVIPLKTPAYLGGTIVLCAEEQERTLLRQFYLDGQPLDGDRFVVTGPHTVSAQFAPCQLITVEQPEGGTVTASCAKALPGDTVTLQVSPAEGYLPLAFTLDGGRISGSSFLVSGDHMVSAALEPAVSSGSCGESVFWRLGESGTLYIYGSGPMADAADAKSGAFYSSRFKVRRVLVADGVTSIGSYAFYEMTNLALASLPDSVQSIGRCAFWCGYELESIRLPGVVQIGEKAFDLCKYLHTVYLSQKLTSVAANAFASCGSLKDNYYGGTAADWREVAIEDGNSALKNASLHTEWNETLLYQLQVRPSEHGTVSLSADEAAVGDTVSVRVDSADPGYALDTVTVDGSAISDMQFTVSGNHAVQATFKKVYDDVEQGGSYGGNTYWALTTDGTLYLFGTGQIPDRTDTSLWSAKYLTQKILRSEITEGITGLGARLFRGCDQMTETVIPSSVKVIGYGAYQNCNSLKSVVIPEGVEEIRNTAFYASGLKYVCLPRSLKTVGSTAFQGSLKDIYYCGTEEEWRSGGLAGNGAGGAYVHYRWSPEYAICAVSAEDSLGGTLSVSPENPYAGETVKLIFTPKSGHYLDYFCVDGARIAGSSFTASGNHTVSAVTGGSEDTYAAGKISDTMYWLIGSDGTLRFCGTGDAASAEPAWNTYSYSAVDAQDGITALPDGAFAEKTLTWIYLPASLRIGSGLFSGLTAERVYYAGSKAQWDAAQTGLTAELHYNVSSADAICTLTLTQPASGSLSASTLHPAIGETVTLQATAPEEQAVDKYLVDGNAIEGDSFVVTGNHTVSVTFRYPLADEGPGGKVGSAYWTLVDGETLHLYGNGSTGSFDSADRVPWAEYLEQIKTVFVHKGVGLGKYALYSDSGCALAAVWIPAGTSMYNTYHFSYSTDFYYGGTKSEWDAKDVLILGARMHYGASSPADLCTITVEGTEHGTIHYTPSAPVRGDDVSFWITQGAGYRVKTVYLDGIALPEGTRSFTVTGDHVLRVEWEKLCDAVEGSDGWALDSGGVLHVYGKGSIKAPAAWQGIAGQIRRIEIYEGVTGLELLAGSRTYPNLTAVSIPASMQKLTFPLFSDCPELRELTLAEGNETYQVKDGMLFRADGTALLLRPAALEGDLLALEDGVTGIAAGALDGCTQLRYAVLPHTLTEIGSGAFDGCSGLQTVFYLSTEADWANVKVYGQSTELKNAVLRCITGRSEICTITTEGNGGTLTADRHYALAGDTVTLTAVPQTIDRTLRALTVDGEAIDGLSFTVSGNHTVRAVFEHFCDAADGGSAGGLFWAITEDGTFYLHGRGETTNMSACPWEACREQIHRVIVLPGVTGLTSNAFSACTALTDVTLPDTLLAVSGFAGCTALKEIELPASVKNIYEYAFQGCAALTRIFFPASLQNVYYRAFDGCTALKDVYYYGTPESRSSISFHNGNDALRYKARWHYITAPEDVCTVTLQQTEGGVIAADTLVPALGEKVKITVASVEPGYAPDTLYLDGRPIAGNMFQVSGDHTVQMTFRKQADEVLGSGVCGETASWYLTKDGTLCITGTGRISAPQLGELKTQVLRLEVSEGIVNIPREAFYGCPSLRDIQLPEGLTSIESSAFYGCALTTVTLPDSVDSIERGAFGGCKTLQGFAVSAENQHYAVKDGVLFNRTQTSLICYPAGRSAASYEIPAGVTTIFSSAFSGCSGLTAVKFPAGVEQIWSGAFSGCSGLTAVQFPESMKQIGDSAFSRCTGLTTVEFPEGVKQIGSQAFRECSSLASLILPDSLTSLGEEAFMDCSAMRFVWVGDALTTIPRYAFWNCRALTAASLPEGLTRIEQGAFRGAALKDVFYRGTEETWKHVSVHSEASLGGAVIHYGTPEQISMELPSTIQLGTSLEQTPLRVTLSNGTQMTVTDGYSCTYDFTEAGEAEVVIRYLNQEFRTTVTVEIIDQLTTEWNGQKLEVNLISTEAGLALAGVYDGAGRLLRCVVVQVAVGQNRFAADFTGLDLKPCSIALFTLGSGLTPRQHESIAPAS